MQNCIDNVIEILFFRVCGTQVSRYSFFAIVLDITAKKLVPHAFRSRDFEEFDCCVSLRFAASIISGFGVSIPAMSWVFYF